MHPNKFWQGLRRVALALLVALALAACGGESQKAVRLGIMAPLTGPLALYGDQVRKGIELALDHRGSGVTATAVHLDYRNTLGDPDRGEALYVDLVQSGAAAVIGPVVPAVASRAAGLTNRHKVVLFVPSASDGALGLGRRYVFRNMPSAVDEAIALGVHCVRDKLKRLAVIHDPGAYGQTLRQHFIGHVTREGLTIAVDESFPSDEEALTELVRRLHDQGVQGIVLAGFYPEVVAFLKAAHTAGLDVPLMATSTVSLRPALRRAGAAAEGLIIAQADFRTDVDSPTVRRFVDAYQKRYGTAPDLLAAASYDAMSMILANLDVVGGSPEAIQQGLHVTKRFDGVTGETSFDGKGEVIKVTKLMHVRQGELVPLH